MNLYIIQCDSFIQDCAHITCEKDWERYLGNLQIHGRGGTDFRPVFEHVEMLRFEGKLRRLKGLLYFTDGDGIYPQRSTTYQTAFVFYLEKACTSRCPHGPQNSIWTMRISGSDLCPSHTDLPEKGYITL